MSGCHAFPHFQQSRDGYCLSACARMVLTYLGDHLSEAEVSQALEAHDFGAPSFAIQKLSTLGFHVDYREWSLPQMLELLQAGTPLIIFVRTAFLEYWTKDVAHALLLVSAEPGQSFVVHDPALPTGPLTVSWNGLLAAWAEFGYRGAAVSSK